MKTILPSFLIILALAAGCVMPAAVEPVILVGAGDISLAESDGDERTSVLLDRVVERFPDAVIFTLGDNSQGEGTPTEYTAYFDPTWGRYKDRIHPIPGNHDYIVAQGAPYYDYFGSAAGSIGKGYYSYDLGIWHVVALDSNCDIVQCDPQSAQARWLREDLEKNRESGNRCTLLYWHHPFWSLDGRTGDSSSNTFWEIANEFGAEVVLNGHYHAYQRFAPQDVYLKPSSSGVRVFVVGTGGSSHHGVEEYQTNSEVLDNNTYGVIQFKLYPGSYEWEFIPVDGDTFTDSGSGTCH